MINADPTTVIGGAGAVLVSVLGWLVKTTTTKANEADALSKALDRRVNVLEEKIDAVSEIKVSVGKLETEVKNIEVSVRRIEAHLLKK